MESQAREAALREKYNKAMEKYTYQGKEPEGKERLRHLFHNQQCFVSSIAPEPEEWNDWTEACIERADWPGLCRVINQRGKSGTMPVVYGGYKHERNLHCMLEYRCV